MSSRLADLRAWTGLSGKAFVEEVAKAGYQVSDVAYYSYEKGETKIPAEFVWSVAQAFDVPIAQVFPAGRAGEGVGPRALIGEIREHLGALEEMLALREGRDEGSGPLFALGRLNWLMSFAELPSSFRSEFAAVDMTGPEHEGPDWGRRCAVYYEELLRAAPMPGIFWDMWQAYRRAKGPEFWDVEPVEQPPFPIEVILEDDAEDYFGAGGE